MNCKYFCNPLQINGIIEWSLIFVIFKVPVNKTHNLNIINILLQFETLLLFQLMIEIKY